MRNNQNNKTQRIVISALMASLVCVATMLIKIPSPLKGYINLGDGVVLLCGFILSPIYGFLAAGIGSALADVFSGYALYAPVTFAAKGLMALVVYYGYKLLSKKLSKRVSLIISCIVAEILMILVYFVFEGFMYGFSASLVNIPPNAVQGLAGIVLGIILMNVFEKTKMKF